MDAMILAAGLGTRLRPITDRTPKALVEVHGTPMLERIARRLIQAGADRLIINLHHHADQVRAFIEARDGFGVDVRLSEEPEAPLETGGGLLHAREHFRHDGPFFLHNVDIISEMDLSAMYRAHQADGGLATLAVNDRPADRVLRFDDAGLQARVNRSTGDEDTARPVQGRAREWAFVGIHVVSPVIFDLMDEPGAFSIIAPYLRLAGQGHRIVPHDVSGTLWLEIGDPDRLERARRILRRANGEEGGDS
jgi:NDP-sugar pyrophosphorylase family protein